MGISSTAGQTPWFVVGLMACASMPMPHALAAASKPAGCLIEPEQVADVGSPVTGVIEDLPVALGDVVAPGQPLARLRADVERANANVALMRAQVDAEVKAAHASWELAHQKVRRSKQLLDQNFVSAQALEQAEAEAEVAAQKLKLAQSQQKIYAREEAVAQAQLGLRTLRSPIKGVIVERYNNLGERVEDKPVVRVAAIDPLRVSLMVPVTQYGQVAVGNSLLIRPELPGLAPVRATVTYVDKVLDAASNSFRVRLSLPNPGNRLPGGLRCKADWTAQLPASPASPGSAAPAAVPAAASGQQAPAPAVLSSPPAVLRRAATAPAIPALAASIRTPATTQPAPRPTQQPMQQAHALPQTLQLKTAMTLSRSGLLSVAVRMAEQAKTAALIANEPTAAGRATPARAPAATQRAQGPAHAPANRLSTTLTLASAY